MYLLPSQQDCNAQSILHTWDGYLRKEGVVGIVSIHSNGVHILFHCDVLVVNSL